MNTCRSLDRQRGMATLFVSLIMLLLITAMVMTAYTLSTTNLRAVSNMQIRNEAIAAANAAIDTQVSTDFTADLGAEDVPVDFDGDGVSDYTVSIAEPECVRASQAATTSVSSVTLPAGMSSAAKWQTVWNFDADVTDERSGAAVNVVTGVRVLLPEAEKDLVCPDLP